MRSFSPVHVRHLLERRFFGGVEFDGICDELITVNPPEPYDYPPSVFLPSQLENIVRLHPETFAEAEGERIYGGSGFHDPIEAYRIRGVKYRNSGLYKHNWRFYFPQHKPAGEPVRVKGGVRALASSYSGIQYFGHWLRDDMTTYLLAEEFAEPFCARTPDWPHVQRYLDIFDTVWPVIDEADFDEIYFFIDYSQNSHKMARIQKLRERMRARVLPKYKNHIVYLRRGDTGAVKRVVSNEADVVKALQDYGAIIVDITKDPIETIIETVLDARLFITVEGSQAAHSLYTIAQGGGYLSIVPPHVFNNPAKDWMIALGMKYGFVVGEADGEAFKVNVADLLKTADMLQAAL